MKAHYSKFATSIYLNNLKSTAMLRLFFAILLSVLISPSIASADQGSVVKTRTFKLDNKFNSIILNGDADIVFVDDLHSEITIEERQGIENSVKIKNEEGLLSISSKNIYRGAKPLILIPVSKLQSLELNGNGFVSTASMLSAKELNVFVNGEFKVQIISSGKVFFDSSPECELRVIKNQRIALTQLTK
jgi:hypothetical protein